MIRNHKKAAILSSAVTLLPVLAGLLLWDRLPESMATHWGADGATDGFGSKPFAVFGLPLILLAMHWLCLWGCSRDSKNRDQNAKIQGLLFWVVPVISLFAGSLTYSVALGRELEWLGLSPFLIGLMFVVLGNYLPKTKQNRTIGIRVSWTLNNEENWNKTHRFAGKLWVAGGLVILFSALLPRGAWLTLMFAGILVLSAVPMVYSYRLYKRQLAAGEYQKKPLTKGTRTGAIIAAAAGAVLTVLVLVLLFTGDIHTRFGKTSLKIEASWWNDLEVDYDAIESLEYREQDEPGLRVSGYGSPRLSMGAFRNDEFGAYTRYTYTGCGACIVLRVQGRVLVIGGRDAESTRDIFNELSIHVE